MTSVVIVADSGSVLADLTAAVGTVGGAHIVRYASGRSPLDRLLGAVAPDLVVIGDLAVAGEALARLGEVRRAAPTAKVVILSSRPDASWLADALRADACAVLPGCVEPDTLAIVLREVIAEGDGERAATPAAIELALERSSRLDRRAARRRRVRVEPSQEGTAA